MITEEILARAPLSATASALIIGAVDRLTVQSITEKRLADDSEPWFTLWRILDTDLPLEDVRDAVQSSLLAPIDPSAQRETILRATSEFLRANPGQGRGIASWILENMSLPDFDELRTSLTHYLDENHEGLSSSRDLDVDVGRTLNRYL